MADDYDNEDYSDLERILTSNVYYNPEDPRIKRFLKKRLPKLTKEESELTLCKGQDELAEAMMVNLLKEQENG